MMRHRPFAALLLAGLGLFAAALVQSRALIPAASFTAGVSVLGGLLWLGKAESLRRLRMAVARLTEQQPNPSPQE